MIVSLTNPSSSMELGEGTYRGYYVRTRWGQDVFHIGPQFIFLSARAAARLAGHAGAALQIHVSKVIQRKNPGPATIDEIDRIQIEATSPSARISTRAESARVEHRAGVRLRIVVDDPSKRSSSLRPEALTVVLLTADPSSNERMGIRDERSYWYHRASNAVINKDRIESPSLAAHEVGVPPPRVPFTARPVAPAGSSALDVTLTVGQELLPGKYQLFVYLRADTADAIGPESALLSFEVR